MFHQVGRSGTLPGYLLPLNLVLDTVFLGGNGQGLKVSGSAESLLPPVRIRAQVLDVCPTEILHGLDTPQVKH